MNILHLTNHLDIGGITSYVLTLGSGLVRRGHKVYVASGGGALVPKFIEEGICYIPIPIKTKQEVSPKILFSMFRLLRVIKENKIELIHSHSRTTQVLGSLLQRASGVAHISTCHGFFKKRFSRRLFPCWGLKVIAISEEVKAHLIQDFKVNQKDVVVVHNGIDLEKFQSPYRKSKNQLKKELGLGDGPVVGIVARLSDVKGHVYLIRAMKNVLGDIPGAQLIIAGEGRMKQELKKLVCELKIESSVFFIPELQDTREALFAMDLFVLPSLKEGLGLALIEAMACGLAAIGSNIGGIKALIKHGDNGLLVEPADIRGLSGAISGLLGNPGKANSFGAAARKFVGENFSQEEMVFQTERVYLECSGKKD